MPVPNYCNGIGEKPSFFNHFFWWEPHYQQPLLIIIGYLPQNQGIKQLY